MEGSSVQARSAGQGLEEACIDRQRSGTGDGSQPTPKTRTEVPILKTKPNSTLSQQRASHIRIAARNKTCFDRRFPAAVWCDARKERAASKLQVACRLAAQ